MNEIKELLLNLRMSSEIQLLIQNLCTLYFLILIFKNILKTNYRWQVKYFFKQPERFKRTKSKLVVMLSHFIIIGLMHLKWISYLQIYREFTRNIHKNIYGEVVKKIHRKYGRNCCIMVCICKVSANTNIILKYIIIIYIKNLLIFETSFKVYITESFPIFLLIQTSCLLLSTVYNNSIMSSFSIY